MWNQRHRWIVPLLVILTILVLWRYPLLDCFDCEGPNPWVRDDAAYIFRSQVFLAWLLASSFLLGVFRIVGAWAAPSLIAAGDFLTQHIGGVPWQSLRDNEGPLIFVFDIGAGMLGLVGGAVPGDHGR